MTERIAAGGGPTLEEPMTDLTEQHDRVRAALRAGLSYDPITVSIAEHPKIRETYRTVSDADRIADELTPVAVRMIAEAKANVLQEVANKWRAAQTQRSDESGPDLVGDWLDRAALAERGDAR